MTRTPVGRWGRDLDVSRRRLLVAAGVAALSGGALALGACTGPAIITPVRATVSAWRARRRAPYLIAHRGVGDLVPEHTREGYEQALAWQAEAVEVSVVRSADGVLFCQHDLDMDRTTTLTGAAAALGSAQIETARVVVPRLGPRWNGDRAPAIPRLDAVLDGLGGRTVLCIEAKDQQTFEPMVELLTARNLLDTVVLKIHGPSSRVERAHELGLPVFGYLGNDDETTATNITQLAARLDRATDCLVIPARINGRLVDDRLLAHAVATGVPIWVFPVHRRHEVAFFAERGVEGIVTADLPYLQADLPTASHDAWAAGAVAAGELTPDPYDATFALRWPGEAQLTLDFAQRPSFALFGQFAPIPGGARGYTISFEAKFDQLPTDPTAHLSIAFGHDDDRPYVHHGGVTNGYHALLRATGEMAMYRHDDGQTSGTQLARPLVTTPLAAGEWVRLAVEVGDERLSWARGGRGSEASTLTATDAAHRGGYFHLGRSGVDGPLTLRNLVLTPR